MTQNHLASGLYRVKVKTMIKLEDIVPQGATFTLSRTKKTYRLRPVSLADEIWLNKEFGAQIETIFREVRMREICRIVFHQLEEESKADFAKQTVTIMNEEGDKVSETKGGAELLFCLIAGFAEKMEIFNALLQTIGISRPMVEKLVAEDEKKSQASPEAQPTGLASSIPYRPSTDGEPSTS
jgi:hypothetical protein